jgi:hypothetical protein
MSKKKILLLSDDLTKLKTDITEFENTLNESRKNK